MTTNKVVIVTGASSGIGASIAIALSKKKVGLVINYNKNMIGSEKVCAECLKNGADALTIKANVADKADCFSLVEKTLSYFGKIDLLVNNAAITRFVPHQNLAGLNQKDFSEIYQTNVIGPFQMAHASRKALEESSGAIVNISSHAGFSGLGSSIAYAASKGALNTLTLSLARALAPKISVNAVCPGFVDTNWAIQNFGDVGFKQFKKKIAEISPLKMIVEPEDVAQAAIWLGLEARAITGQLLVVDAGTHLSIETPL